MKTAVLFGQLEKPPVFPQTYPKQRIMEGDWVWHKQWSTAHEVAWVNGNNLGLICDGRNVHATMWQVELITGDSK